MFPWKSQEGHDDKSGEKNDRSPIGYRLAYMMDIVNVWSQPRPK